MNDEQDQFVPDSEVEATETVAAPASSVCENCNDSGKECYVCGAGRQVV